MFPPKNPRKFSDCLQHLPAGSSELLIVEGDSASDAVVKLRNPECQAVLPMQGKPMNAMKASTAKLENSPLFRTLCESLGVSLRDPASNSKLRYSRIVFLFDPDADGIHCGVLMLLFFYRFLRPVLDSGHVYRTQTPLFEVTTGSPSGQQTFYAYTEPELGVLMRDVRQAGMTITGRSYFRGLANFPASTLKSTCINPASRKLVRLGARDAEAALRIFGHSAQPA